MTSLSSSLARTGAFFMVAITATFLSITSATAAPYAAMVIDARSGEVLHSRNADTRLHPASLTKMMTLYVAFEAVRLGEISLDSVVKISKHAASEPPSKLGLKPGQRIKLRYLIRAAAVRSANDAATAIGEAISGSEAAFARRMNRTAKALGMTKTTFKNAHGLTESGHLSTARDMTTMGRRLFFDYPDYYNLFSRRTTHAGTAEVYNTNRKFLAAYKGADGIKTGYTKAAGFNLVASAERGEKRIIATMFGGQSTATRNRRVAELLDMGFQRAPRKAAISRPALPSYAAQPVRTATRQSPRPAPRPGAASDQLIASIEKDVADALAEATAPRASDTAAEAVAAAIASAIGRNTTKDPSVPVLSAETSGAPTPKPRPRVQAALPTPTETDMPEIVTRMSTSGDRHYGVSIGKFNNRFTAEKALLKTALMELGTLGEALRKVVPRDRAYTATFQGLTRDKADLACRRLQARALACETIGPS